MRPADSDRHVVKLTTAVGEAIVADRDPVLSMAAFPESLDVFDGNGYVRAYELGDGYVVEDWGGAGGHHFWAVTPEGLKAVFERYSPERWDHYTHEFDDPPDWLPEPTEETHGE